MLVVKIELWPMGDESRAKKIGYARIYNDGTGDESIGNYIAEIYKEIYKEGSRSEIARKTKVKGFPRLQLGPFDLLYKALKKLSRKSGNGKRNAND